MTGSSIKAYKGHLENTIVQFDLTYGVYFDTEGYVEFKYRKDGGSVDMKGLDFAGAFKFMVDDKIIWKDT